MNPSTRIIEHMDISDSQKRNIHTIADSEKRNFLNSIGELIDESVNADIDPYVEHTNKGLNLRITVRDQQRAMEIEAIATFCGLNVIEHSRTNANSEIIWLRFAF